MSQLIRLPKTRRVVALVGVLAMSSVGLCAPMAMADQDVTEPTSAVASTEPAVELAPDVEAAVVEGDEPAQDPATEQAPESEQEPALEQEPAPEQASEQAPDAAQASDQAPVDAQAPVVQAAGTVGHANGLALTVLRDGTPNNDGTWDADDAAGNDSSETNGIVRTHDSVVYRWGYSVVTAGDVLLTQVLPEGMSWVVGESVAACAEGANAVSADGRTLSCTRADQPTGASTYQVRAMVDYGANGQVMSSVLSSTGATDSAPATVTVSARPMVNMATYAAAFGARGWNGVNGQRVSYQTYLYQTIDPNRGVRGGEALSDAFSFVIDPSDMGASAQVDGTCQADSGNFQYGTSIGGSYTAENAVPNAGAWTCAQSAPGQPITVTVTGAITDTRSYPTSVPTNGWTPPADRAFIAVGLVTLWIPNSEYPAVRTMAVQSSGFDPDSISGQSNWGDGYAAGQEPGAALSSGLNGGSFAFSLAASLTHGLQRTYAATGEIGYTDPVAPGAINVTNGRTPMFPGQTLRFGGYIGGRTADGSNTTHLGLCAVWDETLMTGGDTEWRYNPISGIEYAHLDLSTDAERRAVDCGTVGDGQPGWASTQEAVTGEVNAVRYVWDETTNGEAPYSAVTLTRTTETLPTGTPLGVFFQVRSDQAALIKSTLDPSTGNTTNLGALALAAEAETAVDVDWDVASSDPGVIRTVTIRPRATVSEGVTATAEDTTVAVTLPSTVSVVADSWPAEQVPTIVQNADGSSTYTFAFGDIEANTEADALTFTVAISSRIQMPSSIIATAVVASPSDPRGDSWRTSTAALIINSPAAFSASMTTPVTYAVPGVPVTYAVSWLNGLSATAGVAKLVDVLPYDGDARGTDGLSGVRLDGVSVNADMPVQVQYTTEPSAQVAAAVALDRSGDSGIGWVDVPAGLNPPSNTTAVRFVTGDVDPGMVGEAWITLTPGALPQDGVVANTLSGAVELLAQPLEDVALVELTSGAVSLEGTVYRDEDYSWTRQDTEVGLSGVSVIATGYTFGANGVDDGGAGDDIAVTAEQAGGAVSGQDGSYRIDGLAPGSWTVSVSGIAASLTGLTVGETRTEPVVTVPTDSITDLDLGYVPAIPVPVLIDDVARVSVGDSIALDVLANDTFDASGAITAISDPAVTEANGQLMFESTEAGEVTFTYTVTDKARQSATATVTVEVVPLPTAAPFAVRVGQTATGIDLAGLVTGDAVTLSVLTGRATVSGTTATYTPEQGFAGADSFTYLVTDSMGKTASAEVQVTVVAAPVAQDVNVRTGLDRAVSADLGAHAVGDALVPIITTDATYGTATVDAAAIITYTPAAGFVGLDEVLVTWTDSVGQTVVQRLGVEVVDAPVANDDVVESRLDAVTEVDLLANDQGELLTVTELAEPGNGSVTLVDGVLTYTPDPGWSGVESLAYTVTDVLGQTASATATITVFAPPVAPELQVRTGVEQSVTVTPMTPATWSLSSSVSWVTAVQESTDGAVVLNPDGSVTFTPAAGFVGTTAFGYTVIDHLGQTTEATIEVTVVALLVTGDLDLQTAHDTAVIADVLTVVDGSSPAVVAVGVPGHGAATMVGADLVYTPRTGFAGVDTFTATVADDLGQTAEVTITVTVAAAEVVPVPPTEEQPPTEELPPGDPERPRTGVLAVTGSGLATGAGLAVLTVLLGLRLFAAARRQERDSEV